MSEECMSIPEQIELIKNLKLPPDFIINIKVTSVYFQSYTFMKQHFFEQRKPSYNNLTKDWFDCHTITSVIHQCPDKDLVNRLSGLRQHPDTGQLYNKEQLQQEDVLNLKDEEEKEEEAELVMFNYMVSLSVCCELLCLCSGNSQDWKHCICRVFHQTTSLKSIYWIALGCFLQSFHRC